MKNKQDISKREKSAAVGLVVCFVAMIAIVGMITFSQYQQRTQQEEQQLAEAEESKDTPNNDMDAPYDLDAVDEGNTQAAHTDTIQAEIETPDVAETPNVIITPAPSQPGTLSFAANEVLMWPMDGNVILSYSMDRTVYFSTLEQYKYNPAILIGGEVGSDILSATDGEITSISQDAKTGTTITMSLGDGYEAVYGQVKDVCVHEGDRVSKGDVLGYLSEPTKYFVVEGPNLYFQLLLDGEPVNPLEYMEA